MLHCSIIIITITIIIIIMLLLRRSSRIIIIPRRTGRHTNNAEDKAKATGSVRSAEVIIMLLWAGSIIIISRGGRM